jgi:tetratricopeptide (TPR) repeat protein
MLEKRDRAHALFDDNQLSPAMDLFSELCAADDHTADDCYMLAVIQSMQGDYHDALHTCERALASYPADIKLNYVLAYGYQQLGRTDDAIDQYRYTLTLAPDLAEASLNLATLLRQNYQHGQALAACQRGLQYQPDNSGLLLEAGTACGLLEQYDDAIDYYLRAQAVEPDLADASYNLAKAYERKGMPEQAIRYYHQALQQDNTDIQSMNDLAVACTSQGQYTEAIAQLERALQVNPKYAEGWNNLGMVFYEQGEIAQALSHFETARSLRPNYAEACNNIGACLLEQGEFTEALRCFDQTVQLQPVFVDAVVNRARVLTVMGHLNEALTTVDRAIQLAPANDEAIAVRLMILGRHGDRDTIRNILAAERNKPDRGLFMTAAVADNCRLLDCCDESITEIRDILQDNRAATNRNLAIELHFLLGKLLDRRGDYDAAFTAFEAGNRLKHKRYDRQAVTGLVDELIEIFRPGQFAKMPRLAGAGQGNIFIVGMPRSGSTLIEQIISSHRDVHGAGELPFISELVQAMPTAYPANLQTISQPDLQELASTYRQRLQQLDTDRDYVTDKMLTNFMHLGLLNLLFPDAHVVHCVRDPVDTCLSCYFHNFAARLDYAYDLDDLAHYYRQYSRLMQHWQSVLSMPMLTVQYEVLVREQEQQTRKLLDFLGLDWDEQCLYFYLNRRPVLTASYDQVRHPMYSDGVQRWRHYQSRLTPLLQGLGLPAE